MSPAAQTLAWVEHFVIAHALCPFAARPFAQGRVVAREIIADEDEAAFLAALTQVQWQVGKAADEVETTLLVFTDHLTDFAHFLDFVYTLEDALADSGADQFVQLAHFHPDYAFADVPADDPSNLTNRSPFPVIQLLRVDSVAAAVAAYPDVEGIPERNVLRMRQQFGT